MTIVTAAAAVSHVGRVRANNQDSGYAGDRLFVVADGMGGHAGGDVASSIAVTRVAETDRLEFASPQEAEFALSSALTDANRLIGEAVRDHPELTGMGTTVSALVRVGDTVVLAHIGDSRIYLFREGELSQVTNDHTFVQRLVDTGRISPEEAAVHPRRSVLMRVLGDIEQTPEIDTSIIGTVPGDRWLLCSDGLSSYVSEERILGVVRQAATAAEVADRLVREALEHGAPDNVTVVVADIDADGGTGTATAATVGAAARPLAFAGSDEDRPHGRRGGLLHRSGTPEARFQPESEDYLEALVREDRRRRWRRRILWLAAIVVLLAGLALGAFVAYQYTQGRYYVGLEGDQVVVYQGVQSSIGPISLSHVVERTGMTTDELTDFGRQQVERTISVESLERAADAVENLRAPRGG